MNDITAIPEQDASFDAIMCIEVFEHIDTGCVTVTEDSLLDHKGTELQTID